MRRAAKRDWTEPEIVRALEAIGVTVARVSSPGVPDLLCWRRDTGYRLIEVKTPRGKLTPDQTALRRRMPFDVVRSVAEVLKLYGVSDPGRSPEAMEAVESAGCDVRLTERKARQALLAAMDRACIARGQAQWTNGYRAGRGTCSRDYDEDGRLFNKEQAQFKLCDVLERQVSRAIAAYALAVRDTKKARKGR